VTGASSCCRTFVTLLWLSGCAGTSGASPETPKTDARLADDAPADDALPEDIVERSRVPLSFRHLGVNMPIDTLLVALAPTRAVCLGESHDDAQHHFAQLELTRSLLAARAGRATAIGFEMFQTPFQAALDEYQRSGDSELLVEQSEFETRWGKTFPYYAPLLEAGQSAGATLLALNAPRELTKAVAKQGIASLSPTESAALPELDLANAEHRTFFERAMGTTFESSANASPHGGLSLENLYAAQVIWDETMALVGSRWLSQNPDGMLIVIAGSAHCQKSAVPGRLVRRGAAPSVAGRAIRISELEGDGAVHDDAFDLLLVLDDRAAKTP
jgi:uncharacterized iron-regulated protein